MGHLVYVDLVELPALRRPDGLDELPGFVEAIDDPDARKIFQDIARSIDQAVGESGRIRTLKIVEDGLGRPIDVWVGEGENGDPPVPG